MSTGSVPGRGGRLRQAIRVGAAVAVLVTTAAAPAQMMSMARAAEGGHGSTHETSSSSGSGEKKTGGGGVGSTVNKVTCGAQNLVNRFTLGFFGSACSSSSGGVDPVQATSSILKQMFAGLAVAASPLLTGTLTQVPDFSAQSGGVVALERSTTAIAFAVAALVLTLSVLRFALAGTSASGGFEGAEGVTRTVTAALAIVAWPWAFHNLAALMNAVTYALLSTHAVHVALIALVAVGGLAVVLFATSSKVGWIFGIVILGLEAILMIGLLLMKVLLAGATTVIFVAMPLALALWPLRETSWIAGRMAHVLFVAVATPLMWALIFATAAVMGGSVFGLHGGVWDTILIRPLAAMSMLMIALWAPVMLLRHAHGGVGHPMGRVAGYTGLRLAANAVSAQVPARLGGRRQDLQAPPLRLPPGSDPIAVGAGGRAPFSVPINGESDHAARVFEDTAADSSRSHPVTAAAEMSSSEAAGAGRGADRAGGPTQAPSAPARTGSAGLAAEDAPAFALREPAALSFAEALAADRVKTRAGQSAPSVGDGRAALDAFSPQMLERIQGRYGAGEAGVDGPRFRATMAASSLSDEISGRQAGALAVLAGMSDQGLGELFAGSETAPAGGQAAPLPPGTQSLISAGGRGSTGERRQPVSVARQAPFADDLAEGRRTPLVVEQPALPPGKA